MSATYRRTRIEFFGGPYDGYQRMIGCRIEDLRSTATLPVPFVTERTWLRPAWTQRAKSEAIYALDRSPDQLGYRYLGTIRRCHSRGAYFSRFMCWLRGAMHRRWSTPGKSNFAH